MTILILGNINHVYGDASGIHDLLQIPWQPEVAADPEVFYGIEVATSLESSFGIKVESDVESVYSLRALVLIDSEGVYGIKVESDIVGIYNVKVESDLQAWYNMSFVQKDVGSVYLIRDFIYSDTLSRYEINLHYDYGDVGSIFGIRVEKDVGFEYTIRDRISIDVHSQYQLIAYVERDIEVLHNISTYNLVYRDVRGVHMLYSPSSETIVTAVLVTVNDG